MPVFAVRDVILLKLVAGRAQDVADLEAILAAKPALDRDHVDEWAHFWEVEALWRGLGSA